MKAAVFYKPGDIRIEDQAVPSLEADEVLIKVMAAGICGTDMHIYAGAKGASECYPPVILGHEISGVVEAIGKHVDNTKIGDHVTVDPSIMCGKCFACRCGKPHFCVDYSATGVTYNGGFAQYCKVKEKQIFHLSPDVPFEEGAMCEPLGCCLHGIDRANIKTGDTVLIIGGGTIGLIMLQLSRLAGASRILVSEPVQKKREKALELGADFVIDPTTETPWQIAEANNIKEINVVIECVGRTETMMDAFRYSSPSSHILLFGLTPPDLEIPVKPYEIFQKELTITASYVNPYTHGRAAELINSRKLRLGELISDRFGLDNIHQAFELKGQNGKMIILPNDSI